MRLGLAACLYLLLTARCCAGDAVTLYYNERPPYLVTAPDGSVTGLAATPAARAFAAAGISAARLKNADQPATGAADAGRAPLCCGLVPQREPRTTVPVFQSCATSCAPRTCRRNGCAGWTGRFRR